MSEAPKKKQKLCERRTISFDADLYALALQRMKDEGETMFSRYVQALVRKDTAVLRAAAIHAKKMGKQTHQSSPKVAGAKILKASKSFVSSASTATQKTSQKVG